MLIRFLNNRLPGLLVASVPFAGWSLFNVGNAFSFTASYVIGVITLIVNFSRLMLLMRVERCHHFWGFYSPWIGACIMSALSLISWDYADVGQYFASLLHIIFFVLVTYCLLQVNDPEKALDFYAKAYTLTALFVAIIGLIDFALILSSGNGLIIEFNTIARTAPSNSLIGVLPRASSIFFEPGWFAHYLLINIIVIIIWILPHSASMRRLAWVWVLRGTALLMFLALIATLSAASYFIAGTILVFVILNRPHPLKTLTLLFIALFIFSLIPLPNDLPNPILGTIERFWGLATGTPVAGESVDTRRAEFSAALDIFNSTFFLGAGYGQSSRYILSVTDVGSGGISSFYGVLLAETGIIGLSAFVACIIVLNYKLWRLQNAISKNGSPQQAQVVFCCRCVILAETLYLNFFSAMASPIYISSFWFALILLDSKYLRKCKS